MNKALDLLHGLISEVERKTCCHEETHRGGAIWEICDSCGAKWADDEGGKPEFAWPESVDKARAFLATHPAVEQAGGDERAACNLWIAEQQLCQGSDISLFTLERNGALVSLHDLLRDAYQAGQDRAALAQPSPAPAEAERPEVVGYLATAEHPKHGQPHKAFNYFKDQHDAQVAHWRERGCEVSDDELMTVAQHGRIVGALRAKADQLREALEWRKENQAGQRELLRSVTAERDAALARVVELERQEPVAWGAFHFGGKRDGKLYTHCETEAQIEAYILDMHRSSDSLTLSKGPLYAAPVDQAQHSVPDGAADLCRFLAKLYCELDGLRYSTAKLPAEQIADALIFKWPVLQGARNQLNIKRISEQPYDESKLHSAIAAMLAAAPGKEVPQAWLDVQAERRRQITAEGWTPEHDDLYCAAELPRAAAAYILNGANDEAPAIWPFVAKWWKPRDARSNYVRAGALILAEIERLDRAAPGKEVGHE
ncbi:hypothetical protein [Pseudomonas aeruginosa]|uniref:hypothetical protein n=1 Tax=Pseudomonas aeruginosa TaxID=287 RepID=UPI00071B0B31|nr:hypothetical protein [Pseudomonas aeruginosa]